jgi:lipopolysaccharide exporter
MKNPLLSSGFYTLLQRVSNLLFGFGGFYLLIRNLNKEDFGTWILLVTVTALLEVARNGLVQNSLIKHLIGASATDSKKIQTAAWMLNIGLTIFSCLFLWLVGPVLGKIWSSPNFGNLCLIYCLTSVVLIPFQQFSYLQQAEMDFKALFWMYFIRQGSFFFYILYFYVNRLSLNLEGLSYALCISSGVSSIGGYFASKRYVSFAIHFDQVWLKKLFHYGKYSLGTNISGMIFGSIDQMMLGSLVGPAGVALYSSAFRINNLLEIPVSTAASILFPQASHKANANDLSSVKELYENSVAILLAMLFPVVIIASFLPHWIVKTVAGVSYSDATQLLQVIMIFSLIQPFTRQFGMVMDAIGKPNLNFYSILGAAFGNAILNYVLIPPLGALGAAIATLIAISLSAIVNLIILKTTIEVSFISIVKNIFKYYYRVPSLIKACIRRKSN